MRMQGGQMPTGTVYGKIVDAASGKAVPVASVQVVQQKMDSATKQLKNVVVAGMLTENNGDFRLENIPLMPPAKLIVTAIGFEEQTLNITFIKPGQKPADIMNALDKDMGNIKIRVNSKMLEDVVVTSTSKSLVQLAIDRKIFNVEKDLSAAGGTGIDVLRNVPSVIVDIDGNVTLRNSSPIIYIDGRPSPLSLDQIPADQIQSVEVITNPSAKFDASGGTAGILNIVLKKNRKAGYNGSVRASIDQRGMPGGGLDINVKQGKINVFANVGYNSRKSISNGETERLSTISSPNTRLFQNDESTQKGQFLFSRFGADYFITNRSTISLTGGIMRGRPTGTTVSNLNIDSLYSTGNKSSYMERLSNNKFKFNGQSATLGFLHNFPKNGHQLTADINYFAGTNENNTLITNNTYNNPNQPLSYTYSQQQSGKGDNKNFTFQSDYTNPVSDNSKWEAGIRYNQRNVSSLNNISALQNGQYVIIPVLSNEFDYIERVGAAYTTYTGRFNKTAGYQLGLRVESSGYEGTVYKNEAVSGGGTVKKSETFSNSFPLSFFPSIFLSKEIDDQQQLQFNYARKVNRPQFMQLFPFTDYSDSLNLSRGNPDLEPEFTNSLELSYQLNLPKSNSFLFSVYSKFTNNLLTRYQVIEPDALTGKSVLVNTFTNANSSFVGGLELIAKNKPLKWWDLTTNLNLFTSKINMDEKTIETAGQIYSWFGKLTNNFKLGNKWSLQITADYTSKTVLSPGGSASQSGGRGMGWGPTVSGSAQGYSMPSYGVDAALKFEFLKNKAASITLNGSDLLKTRVSDVYTNATGMTQHVYRFRDQQFFRINFNYRFGKFDMSLFKRKNNRMETEGMQGM